MVCTVTMNLFIEGNPTPEEIEEYLDGVVTGSLIPGTIIYESEVVTIQEQRPENEIPKAENTYTE